MVDSIFYEKYLVVQIPKAALQELLYLRLFDMYIICNQDRNTINCYAFKLAELLIEYHSDLTWGEVNETLKKGLSQHFGEYDKVTVRLVMTWLKLAKDESIEAYRNHDTCDSQSQGESLDWIRFIRWCNQHIIPSDIYDKLTIDEFKQGLYEGKFKRRRLC